MDCWERNCGGYLPRDIKSNSSGGIGEEMKFVWLILTYLSKFLWYTIRVVWEGMIMGVFISVTAGIVAFAAITLYGDEILEIIRGVMEKL